MSDALTTMIRCCSLVENSLRPTLKARVEKSSRRMAAPVTKRRYQPKATQTCVQMITAKQNH
jgi:hypothetical protein